MDINKQRLKNRLNVKFEPLKLQPASMKKLGVITRDPTKETERERDKEGSMLESSRNRSITHLRLPSLDRKSTIIKKIQDKTEQIINMREMRQRIKSIKVLPTIKVESREPINNTITYLMRNQILNIPKIVAMLQKSESEEFLYMKVTGIYEFEVCSEQDKGNSYITVSRNGMVREGELTSLDKLIHEYQLYSRLKKNHYFKYYLAIKFMNRWHRGSRMIKFIQNKFKLKRLLFLDNERVIAWKVELKEMLFISDRGGHVNSGWVNRVAKEIGGNKENVQNKLLQISVKLLQKFQLPISQSFQLMNKVLSNLLTLNINFEKKIRIEKELQLVYKLGMMLQFYQMQSIAFFLINHIDLLSIKFEEKSNAYVEGLLKPMEALDFKHANYVQEKEKLLLSSTCKQEINFKMRIDSEDEVIIQPSMRSILVRIKEDIKQFVSKVQSFDYHIIRVSKFDYVVKNVVKPHEVEQSTLNHHKDVNLKEYIYSINAYYEKLKELQANTDLIDETIQRRIKLTTPFHAVYLQYKQKSIQRVYATYNFEQINEEIEEIEENITICQNKLHDGEYFILGYLSQLQIKQQIINFIKQYKERVLAVIPAKIRQNKQKLVQSLNTHLQTLRIVIKNADDFIKVYSQCDQLQDRIVLYSADLLQIERLQDLYLRIKKIQSMSLVEEKSLMNQLKMKVKNYRQTKENSYLLYKKELETYRKELVGKVDAIVPSELYYELTPKPLEVFQRCHDNNTKLQGLSAELKHLNHLEGFFDIKTTLIPKLQTLLMKFESLEDIWQIYKDLQLQKDQHFYSNIMKIEVLPLIKKYQFYMRKAERYNKDPDYYKLAQHLLQQIPLLLNSFYFIEDLHNPILRNVDFDQITQLLQRQYKIGRQTSDLTLFHVYEKKLYLARDQLLQINFKSHKEQQIQRMLKEYDVWWKGIKLQGQYLDEYPLIIIFGDNDQLRRQIQQYTTILLNIINHKYGGFARRDCNNNLRSINKLAGLLQLAIIHQEKFLSLFPILTSKYAEKQLPSQAKKFMSIIHKSMKNVKWLIRPTENLNENTKSLLDNHIKQFDAISKTLAHFLEKKRVKFQRFYFLQDDELLQVLVGIGAQNTIFRMFEGIKGWLVDKEGVKCGVEGIGRQNLVLRGWSYKHQEPQIIFKSLEDSIRTNLNSIVRTILHNYENQMKQLKNLYPGMPWMCVYTVQLILFTKQMEINCFQNGVEIAMQASLIQQNISASVANPLENSNYITLQLFLLHFTEQLRHQSVTSIFDFKWHSFLRYYYEKDSVVMKIMGSQHNWGGQYQGLWNLMINTSDIRRAHTSILSNIKYGNGVLLQGPSGTGKTESLKQLGRCMAKYCVIFNCSSQVNIRTLQKLLSGLCYTGSWLCLDQINRLTAQIMSVVANQINSIKNAVVQSKEVFSFMGKDMKLKRGVGIFSTMNPIYLKRAKLTQSLKTYFRIISVNVPDYEKILQVMLYSLGIASSSVYSHKISMMFKNLSIQLSLRSQYDFGLRAMKFFIFNLSIIRKTFKNEEESIIEALCKTFYSRLQAEDREGFMRIIQDMFGRKVEQKQVTYKVAMMKQAPQTGIIVLGPTSSKTTLINEYVSLFNPTTRNVEVFNPNSLQLKYFLGQNIMGRWEQGVVQKMARGSFENSNIDYLLILDCKLKSETIQNFNTLLDDSKLLSLSNGTRLKIHNNFKVILETPDLEMTSPATITRCNVIYVSQSDISRPNFIKKLLPFFNSIEFTQKMKEVLQKFDLGQMQRIIKMARLIFLKKISSEQKLTQSESIGFEKSVFFAIQLLGKSDRVKQYLHKDNSIVSKKSIFNYYLSFNKYRQGEFLELQLPIKQIQNLGQIYIPTLRGRFYEYVNMKAYDNCENVLWKGEKMTGKTSSIAYSIQEVFRSRPEDKNMLRVTVNPEAASKAISMLIEERMSGKEQKQEKDLSKKMLLFVDDIHLANEEVGEFFRYAAEYQKIFSYKSKEIVQIPRHSIIADSNNTYNKQFLSRFSRHFAEISLPPIEQPSIKSIYGELIRGIVRQTRTSADFKATYELQVERVSHLLSQYLKINNKWYRQSVQTGSEKKQELQNIGFCSLLPVIKNLRIINDSFCKESGDFITFMLSQLRSQEVEHRKSTRQMDYIKMAYTQVFKHRFQAQYDKTLKSLTGHPSQSLKYSSIARSSISPLVWETFKTHVTNNLQGSYYISQFMLLEILKVLRVLQWQDGNYYLIGAPGVGRRTILKISNFLSGIQSVEALPDEKKISQWYFGLIKSAFQKRKEHSVIVQLDGKDNFKLLSYLQKIANKSPIQELISSENCEYAYSEINEYSEVSYDKYSKSYDEVISDFIVISRRKIQFLFYSSHQPALEFTRNYHYLHQQTLFRFIQEVPSQSILQISNQILQKSLTQQQVDRKGLTTIFLKIYGDLTALMRANQHNHKMHFKYNSFYHYKVITRFIGHFRKLTQRARQKEDVLNRSILKVHQISQILEKLKVEIKEMEPKVKEKTQKLREVVPVLQQKKRASQDVRVLVLNQKRQIESRNAQIEEMVKEVEEKISRAEPILQEANDSMLTLKRSELSQLRNNPNPHPLIRFTLENMVILLGENESWENIKKVLSDPGLLTKLKAISPSVPAIQKTKRRIQQNKQWTFDNVSKVSFGVRYMVRWINNIIKFYQLKYSLDSEKMKVEDYKKELQKLQSQLSGKQRELDLQEDEIRIIQEEYTSIRDQLKALQELININNKKFENAELIKDHLHEEINNWYDKLAQYKTLRKNSEATAILVTLFLQVFSTLHLQEQITIQQKVREHFAKFSFNFDPDFDIFDYIKESLLRRKITEVDKHPKQNSQNKSLFSLQALTIEDASNPKIIQTLYHLQDKPILLDPDNQAINWIQRQLANEGENGIRAVITKQSFIGSTKSVQSAMRDGHILVLIIQDDLDQFTTDILNAKITDASGSKIIEYNKNILHVNANFKLLLCNKSRNPDLSSKLYISYPILNFQITKNMLKTILLQELLILQNRDIYNIRKGLQMQKKMNEKVIAQVQEMIIDSLISSKKTLIDDNEFINLLTENQTKRGILKQNEAQWRQKTGNIKRIYDTYGNITQLVSQMFISLKQMAKINPLLSWNSQIFVQYFTQAVQASISSPLFDEDDEEEPQSRLLKQSNFQFDHYSIGLGNSRPTSALSFISGLSKTSHEQRKDDFEEEHPTSPHSFESLIGHRQMQVDDKQRGTMSAQREKAIKNIFIQFVKFAFTEEERVIWGLVLCLMEYPWKDVRSLIEIKARRTKLKEYLDAGQLTQKIKNLASQNERLEQELSRSFAQSNPFAKLSEHLSELQVLLLCKLLNPSKFNSLSKCLIRNKGFGQILDYSQAKPMHWFQRSDNIHPILLLMGEDPLSRISDYLTQKKYKNVILIPMGEGQSKLAEMVLQRESKRENLVIIHNLQISQNFLLFLSKMLQQFQIRPPHKNFRLVLISTPFENLNEQITSYCHKYLVQQPSGIKNQMQYLRQINPVSLVHPTHKKLEFVITYLHALINNLSKYKPYGWNLKYQFNTTDFLNSVQTLKEVAESALVLERYECNIDLDDEKEKLNADQIDYKALRYMLGEIGYVGKLADDIDRAKMKIIINQFINPNIFTKDTGDNELGLRGIKFSKLDLANLQEVIDGINQNDASIFGLHPSIKPISEYPHYILSKLGKIYSQSSDKNQDRKQIFLKPIQPIAHKFQYINKEITKFNADIERIKMEGPSQALLKTMGNGLLLSTITPVSKIFSLKAFSNPREFFIAIKKDVAQKGNVIYEKVELTWSLVPRESLAGVYGISGIKLQGGSINVHGSLDDEMQQQQITLYVQAVVRKKEKDARRLVAIPLYLSQERQGQINSYGDNTNLLVSVRVQAGHPQEFWILRSTAFIVM